MDSMTLPAALTSRAQWVNWDPATKRPRPAIDRRLLTYSQAQDTDPAHVGYVFTAGCPFAGIDIDEMTELASELLRAARAAGAYVERSPSGKGWHIIGTGRLPRGIGKGSVDAGVEAYSQGRYFTCTGEGRGDPEVGIQALLDRLMALRAQRIAGGDNVDTPGVWNAAEHMPLLERIDPDPYEAWVQTGMALRAAGAPLAVWQAWSQGSAKYRDGECTEKWASFKGEGVGLGTLYMLAREGGWDETQAWASPESFEDLTEERAALETQERAQAKERNPWKLATVWGHTLVEPPPARTWAWDQWIPHGVVTGLAGPPGVAKSTLALQLCVHHVLGMPFLGGDIAAGPAMFITVEDDGPELHRRLHRICDALFCEPAELDGLALVPAVDMLTSLVTVTKDGGMKATPRLKALRAWIAETDAKLVVLDLVGDFWDGNENARGEVTAYVRHYLGRVAARHGLALLVISHLNKAGEVSGSTAWLGSFRSAMSLTRDGERLYLERIKANYAPPMERPEVLRWQDGYVLPVPREEMAQEDEAVLDLAHARLPEDEWLGIRALRRAMRAENEAAARVMAEVLVEDGRLEDRVHGGNRQWRRV